MATLSPTAAELRVAAATMVLRASLAEAVTVVQALPMVEVEAEEDTAAAQGTASTF
jgi:hypothetical protein